jgi:hypothetical protein
MFPLISIHILLYILSKSAINIYILVVAYFCGWSNLKQSVRTSFSNPFFQAYGYTSEMSAVLHPSMHVMALQHVSVSANRENKSTKFLSMSNEELVQHTHARGKQFRNADL